MTAAEVTEEREAANTLFMVEEIHFFANKRKIE
jgi:hypothetical protein